MAFRVLVGLPSRDEADTIGRVAVDLDRALTTLPFDVDPVLANVDNSTSDATVDAFLAAPTRSPRWSRRLVDAPGKGANWRSLLEQVRDGGYDGALLVDTDLAGVPAEWVHGMLGQLHAGAEFCFPRRPPTWNGGDLTYHLAHPALAATFGADLSEPLCGEVGLSGTAAEEVLSQDWTDDDLGYGVDFLLASVAARGDWRASVLTERRRNKLRSFADDEQGEFRMGTKFAEVARSVRHRAGLRLREPSPERLQGSAGPPLCDGREVPGWDPDIDLLARSSTTALRRAVADGGFDVFATALTDRLYAHVATDPELGLSWPVWRDCLLAWIADGPWTGEGAPVEGVIPVELLETLFLNRVVGHHREIAGTTDWHGSVRAQARDCFDHRHVLWARR